MTNDPKHPARKKRGIHRVITPKVRRQGPLVAFAALVAAAVVGTGFNVANAGDRQASSDVQSSVAVDPMRELDEQATRDKQRTLEGNVQDGLDQAAREQAAREREEAERAEEERRKAEEEAKRPKWQLPSKAPISDVFGPRGWRGGEMHAGTDFAANQGEDNYAAFDGVVVQAGWNGGYGQSVTIDHGDGVETLYGHFSAVSVQVGEKVKAGDVLGQAGSTGDVTGPHLHFEVHRDGVPIDPVPFLHDQGLDF